VGGLSISNKILERYFGYLKFLDNSAKKKLISKLNKSMSAPSPKKADLESLFGAWEDHREADEIISDIKQSRVEKTNIVDFE